MEALFFNLLNVIFLEINGLWHTLHNENYQGDFMLPF